ncbi:MAG TPA: hypothetical protein VFM54_04575 [Micromonosporaceae bacterium]|nr:hypothetical protein [Micromonosporaceae bacterium]
MWQVRVAIQAGEYGGGGGGVDAVQPSSRVRSLSPAMMRRSTAVGAAQSWLAASWSSRDVRCPAACRSPRAAAVTAA